MRAVRTGRSPRDDRQPPRTAVGPLTPLHLRLALHGRGPELHPVEAGHRLGETAEVAVPEQHRRRGPAEEADRPAPVAELQEEPAGLKPVPGQCKAARQQGANVVDGPRHAAVVAMVLQACQNCDRLDGGPTSPGRLKKLDHARRAAGRAVEDGTDGGLGACLPGKPRALEPGQGLQPALRRRPFAQGRPAGARQLREPAQVGAP